MDFMSVEIFHNVGVNRELQINLFEVLFSIFNQIANLFLVSFTQLFNIGLTLLSDPSNVEQAIEDAIVTVGIGVTSMIVNIIAEVEPDTFSDYLAETFDKNDPICLEMGTDVRYFYNNTNCIIGYNVDTMQLSGVSSAKFDDLEIKNYNYDNNSLSLDVFGNLQFETLNFTFFGNLTSKEGCNGSNQTYAVIATMPSPILQVAAALSGADAVEDLGLGDVSFTELELRNTDYVFSVGNLSNYSSVEIEDALKIEMSYILEYVINDIPEQFLECGSDNACINNATFDINNSTSRL